MAHDKSTKGINDEELFLWVALSGDNDVTWMTSRSATDDALTDVADEFLDSSRIDWTSVHRSVPESSPNTYLRVRRRESARAKRLRHQREHVIEPSPPRP
ncbi:hypothetical protein F4560_003202 [Saccharothrix ecbatanensis]|uniref:Uncharacterized protein n=1 Tax=Saccharothrix ecbatanensis TaxID=1105145 RepID=A0A7W9HJH0_9PSEU|nr:hypothetical protein [Saccharothrix ecbatanensis]